MFTANGSGFGVISPVPPSGSTTYESENGNRFHNDESLSELPEMEGVDTSLSVQNSQRRRHELCCGVLPTRGYGRD